MAVGLHSPSRLPPVAGLRIGTAEAGIKYRERPDLVVFELAAGSQCAAMFTRNRFCAAPVILARQHLQQGAPRYLVINSGNANAGTGEAGLQDASAICARLAALGNCATEAVLPFSTGVIGEPLPVERICKTLPTVLKGLDADAWLHAAHAIMTTDTVAKGAYREIPCAEGMAHLVGIAKGSGMIRPDMATMLVFIATDLAVAPAILQRALRAAVAESFHRITVDGDTSTNDACVLVATGAAAAPVINSTDDPGYAGLCKALGGVCQELAQAIVRDGEGATKFITIEVCEGASEQECLDTAFTIAHSPLVKSAFFASDPNWGRILAAVGRAPLPRLAIDKIRIHLGEVCIVENGGRAADYHEELGQAVMDKPEIPVRISLGRGSCKATVWTSDLSYDYVRINAEYRT